MPSPQPQKSTGIAALPARAEKSGRLPHGLRWQGLLWPVVALTAGLVAIILILLVFAAARQNELALHASEHLASRALQSEMNKLADEARDYTTWDDAVENLVLTLDEEWADDNIGTWAHEGLGVGATLVVDGKGRPFYAMIDGERITENALDRITHGLGPLIVAARRGDLAPVGLSVTGYTVVDGQLAMAAAAPIIWEDARPALERGEGRSILIYFRRLDDALLAQLEEASLLPDLHLHQSDEAVAGAQVHLESYGGETLGTLTWTAEQPGYRMLRSLMLPGFIAGAVALVLFWVAVRRASLAMRELETSHAKLESQAAELTAARDHAEQQMRVESELRHNADAASRAKSEFLALISHELRTPLNAILGFSETIARQTFGRNAFDRYREYAQHIHDSGTHLLSIINDILDLSKVEARRFDLNEKDVALGNILERCITLVRERANEKNLDISCQATDLWVRVDERAMKQILINLLTNAIKFTEPGGRVRIDTLVTAEDVAIAIRDTGIGMTEEGLARAMLPFGQAASALTRTVEGTGLGLNVTQALIQLHGGYLTITSAPDQGTTVVVHLPAERMLPPEPKAVAS